MEQVVENAPVLTNGSVTTKDVPASPYRETETSLKVHRFEETVLGRNVAVEVLIMNSSLYIWIGPSFNANLNNMCISMPSRFDTLPLASALFGETHLTTPFAQKLSKKLNKPVFLSLNFPDHHLVPHIERVMFEDIKRNCDVYL